MTPRDPRRSGFTLIEIMVALTVLAILVSMIYQVLLNSVRGQDMVREGLRAPKVQNAILGQIFRDFRYLYWDDFTGDTGFVGKNKELGGKEADIIDFVTSRPSRTSHLSDESARDDLPSPLTEVGYALRQNDENPDWLELWRREDWFVDDNPVKGGTYSLIYDRITKFSLLYFPIPEENVDSKGQEEWDTRVKHKLPYAIVLEIQFDVEEPTERGDEEAKEHISRIIILKGAYNVKAAQAPGQGDPPPGR